MSDDAYAALVAAQLEIDACNKQFCALIRQINDDDAAIRDTARRAWAELIARHRAARRIIEEAHDAA